MCTLTYTMLYVNYLNKKNKCLFADFFFQKGNWWYDIPPIGGVICTSGNIIFKKCLQMLLEIFEILI